MALFKEKEKAEIDLSILELSKHLREKLFDSLKERKVRSLRLILNNLEDRGDLRLENRKEELFGSCLGGGGPEN